jgi:hypothetical protein
MPVAFILGLQLFPLARSDGWLRAMSVGLLLGWIAPPAGACEIVYGLVTAGSFQEPAGVTALWGFVLVPYAVLVSFVAIVLTLPAGLVWALAVRLAPESLLIRNRAPAWLARFGARHLFGLLAAVLAAAVVIGFVTGRP